MKSGENKTAARILRLGTKRKAVLQVRARA